jgi:hypothetical protein
MAKRRDSAKREPNRTSAKGGTWPWDCAVVTILYTTWWKSVMGGGDRSVYACEFLGDHAVRRSTWLDSEMGVMIYDSHRTSTAHLQLLKLLIMNFSSLRPRQASTRTPGCAHVWKRSNPSHASQLADFPISCVTWPRSSYNYGLTLELISMAQKCYIRNERRTDLHSKQHRSTKQSVWSASYLQKQFFASLLFSCADMWF